MTHRHPDAHTPELHEAPDPWHLHTADEERPQQAHGEIGNPHLVTAVGLGAFFMVAVTCLIVYGYYNWYSIQRLGAAEKYPMEEPMVAARTNATEALTRGYTWADHQHV